MILIDNQYIILILYDKQLDTRWYIIVGYIYISDDRVNNSILSYLIHQQIDIITDRCYIGVLNVNYQGANEYVYGHVRK